MPYVDGCIIQASLSGTVTTPDVIVQQSDPEHAALIFSIGKNIINKVRIDNNLFILET